MPGVFTKKRGQTREVQKTTNGKGRQVRGRRMSFGPTRVGLQPNRCGNEIKSRSAFLECLLKHETRMARGIRELGSGQFARE